MHESRWHRESDTVRAFVSGKIPSIGVATAQTDRSVTARPGRPHVAKTCPGSPAQLRLPRNTRSDGTISARHQTKLVSGAHTDWIGRMGIGNECAQNYEACLCALKEKDEMGAKSNNPLNAHDTPGSSMESVQQAHLSMHDKMYPCVSCSN